MLNLQNSIIEQKFFKDIPFFIKRDDLIDKYFNGNKARKLFYLLNQNLDNITEIISYGGVQSNAMLSLAAFCKLKNKKFLYYTKSIPSFLRKNPHGNLRYAIELDMEIFEIGHDNWGEFISNFQTLKKDNNLLIYQGVAQHEAELGFIELAKEIENFANVHDLIFDIFLPSGTGVSAYYLQKHIKFNVFTTNCVGSIEYLKEQMRQFDSDIKKYPIILEHSKKYHFGKLYKELFDINVNLMKETDIEFCLLYDSVGWITLLENINNFKNKILYIHCGGTIGNESMKLRYDNS